MNILILLIVITEIMHIKHIRVPYKKSNNAYMHIMILLIVITKIVHNEAHKSSLPMENQTVQKCTY